MPPTKSPVNVSSEVETKSKVLPPPAVRQEPTVKPQEKMTPAKSEIAESSVRASPPPAQRKRQLSVQPKEKMTPIKLPSLPVSQQTMHASLEVTKSQVLPSPSVRDCTHITLSSEGGSAT